MAGRFDQNAHESNDVRLKRLRAEGISGLQLNQLATVAKGELGLERQPAKQFRSERRPRTRIASDEKPRRADVDDVVPGEFLGEQAGAKPPVAADVDTP